VVLQPTFVKARLQRGNLFLKMGKFNEAQGDYEAVVSQQVDINISLVLLEQTNKFFLKCYVVACS